MNKFAYEPKKAEKKAELVQLTLSKAKSPNTGVCGRKTANLCVILFLNGKGQALLDQYKPLTEQFLNDPVTFTYVYSNEEPHMTKQFEIQNNVGAVIYKPKRAKYA